MTAFAVAPIRRVPKQKMVVDASLGLVLLARFIALTIAGVVVAIRIHRRSECDPLAIRRPLFISRSGGARGERIRFAAIQREQIDLFGSRAAGYKCEPLAIRRPLRTAIRAPTG